MFFVVRSKVGTYSIKSVGHGPHEADPGFVAVSPQVTVINPVVGRDARV